MKSAVPDIPLVAQHWLVRPYPWHLTQQRLMLPIRLGQQQRLQRIML
jgi:hypothetical protein